MTKKEAPGGVHAGHRERMRDRYYREGISGFADHEVLEMMLYYCTRVGNTNPLAHALLDRFGSLAGVLDAPEKELLKVDGVGEVTVSFMKQLPDFYRRYRLSAKGAARIFSYGEAGRRFVDAFIGMKEEHVQLMLLDSQQKQLWCGIVCKGSVTASAIYVKPLVRLAVQYDAVYAILAHNHPSGSALPSTQDLEATQKVKEALRAVEVTLADHIIVAGDTYLSLQKSGYFSRLFEGGARLSQVADSALSEE